MAQGDQHGIDRVVRHPEQHAAGPAVNSSDGVGRSRSFPEGRIENGPFGDARVVCDPGGPAVAAVRDRGSSQVLHERKVGNEPGSSL